MLKIPTYTNEELLDRMWAKEDIIQTMNRHCYYQSNGERAKEIDTLWVSRPENAGKASYGFNNGYYVGIGDIRRFYVDDYNGYRGDGTGYAEYHSAASPLVVVADDGQSARYLGFHFSYACKVEADGKGAAFQTTGLTFADLILEDGTWKILNLVEESDHTFETGKNYAELEPRRWDTPDPLDYRYKDPTIKRIVYNPLFGWEYMYSDMPKPYDTYRAEDSYGPEGKLNKPYYERERRVF